MAIIKKSSQPAQKEVGVLRSKDMWKQFKPKGVRDGNY
nr:MAG TPA: hypothetical protein [Caudoviricetes sp.]